MLADLLASVPSGWKERGLYQAWRSAQRATNEIEVGEAICRLHDALREHRVAEARRKAEAVQAAREYEMREQRAAEVARLVEAAGAPTREQLLVKEQDYQRENTTDRAYRRKWLLRLLQAYENRCAICGASDQGLDLDHFFIPKCHGGNFVLRHQDGFVFNNAVPMCEPCNRAKGARPYREFLRGREDRLITVLKINKAMNHRLNEASERQAGERSDATRRASRPGRSASARFAAPSSSTPNLLQPKTEATSSSAL